MNQHHDVVLFEKDDRPGGHSNTVDVNTSQGVIAVDTGFIVFNNNNYPDLIKLFEYLNIDTDNSDMSFSISIKDPEFEYGSSNLNSLFAQKKNLFSLHFWLLLKDIIKLYNHCKKISFLKI